MNSGLELDRAPPRRAEVAAADGADWYPKPPKNDWRWLATGIKRVVVVVVVVVVGVNVARAVWGSELPGPLRAVVDVVDRVRAGEAINEDGRDADCFTGSPGEYIVYDDEHGTAHIVEKPSQVPARYRAKARCSSAPR